MFNQVVKDRFYKYLIPMFMTSFALSLSEFMDSLVVSNLLNSDALAVLNMSSSFNFVISALFCLFGIGGSISYAKYQGMANRNKAESIYSISITCALFTSLLLSIACYSFPDAFAGLICKSTELRPMFDSYIKIQVIAAPFMCTIMTAVSFLPAAGHPIEAMVFNIGYNVSNIVLDIVFVGYYNLGVRGAAYSTFVTLVVWAVGMWFWLKIKKSQLKFSIKKSFDIKGVTEIISLGFAIAIAQGCFAVKVAYSNAMLNELFGKQGLITFSVCMQLMAIMAIFLSGMLRTVTPLVSMLNGQKDYVGIKQSMTRGMRLLAIVSFAMVGFIIAFPEVALNIYNAYDPATEDIAVMEIRVFSIVLGLRCLYMLYMSYVNVLGRKKYGLFISLYDGFIGLLIFAKPMVLLIGEMGFWWSYAMVSVVLCVCIAVINRVIVAGSNGELDQVFLLKKDENKSLHITYDKQDKNSLAEAGKQAFEFAKENGFSSRICNIVGLISEEYPYYIVKHVKNTSLTDSIISCSEGEVVISFRIIGRAYENAWLNNNENEENNRIVESFVKDIDYSYVMGINYSRIHISEKD